MLQCAQLLYHVALASHVCGGGGAYSRLAGTLNGWNVPTDRLLIRSQAVITVLSTPYRRYNYGLGGEGGPLPLCTPSKSPPLTRQCRQCHHPPSSAAYPAGAGAAANNGTTFIQGAPPKTLDTMQ